MNNKDQSYYQNLLEQYIAGTISKADRFELEKRALDDPFLFEALEGAHQQGENKSGVLKELKSEIKNPSAKKDAKRIPLQNYAIAASLVLLLSAGMWFFSQSNGQQENLAMETTPPASEQVASLPESDSDQEVKLELVEEETQSVATRAAGSNNQYDSPKATISTSEPQDDVIASSDETLSKTQEREPDVIFNNSDRRTAIVPSPAQPSRSTKPSPQNTAVKLEAEKPQAPIAATSKRKPAIEATISEELADESVDDAETVTTAAIKQEELSLDRKEYLETTDGNILVTPEGGITEFKNSLKETSQKFEKIVKESGDNIVIQFKISQEGQSYDFDVVSGTDQDCINRIITMLKYGPKWITTPANQEASVRVELPCY